jgi:hypothetical protein
MYEGWQKAAVDSGLASQDVCFISNSPSDRSTFLNCEQKMCGISLPASWMPAEPLQTHRNWHRHCVATFVFGLALAVVAATENKPDLAKRRISPHTIRHTTAMHLLQAGVDISVIALWLGHESPVTTHHYVEADLTMKERALSMLHEPEAKTHRYTAPDSLIDFLKKL